jgi:hypothetical protein
MLTLTCSCAHIIAQANIFGPLLKIRMAHTGREVGAHMPPTAMKAAAARHEQKQQGASGSDSDSGGEEGHVIMVLHGGLLSIPSNQSTTALVNQLLSQELTAGAKSPSGPLAK